MGANVLLYTNTYSCSILGQWHRFTDTQFPRYTALQKLKNYFEIVGGSLATRKYCAASEDTRNHGLFRIKLRLLQYKALYSF